MRSLLGERVAGMALPDARLISPPGLMVPNSDNVTAATAIVANTALTNSGVANTKSSWVEVVASTSEDCNGLQIVNSGATNAAGNSTGVLLDVGVGAAASEVVIVPDVLMGSRLQVVVGLFLPVFIPKGSRVALRFQSDSAALNPGFRVRFFTKRKSDLRFGRYLANYGADQATSFGVSIVSGAANSKTAWTEITAATTERMMGGVLTVQTNGDNTMTANGWVVDVGAGASGSEIVICPDIYYSTGTNESADLINAGMPWFPCDVPAGTRLAARFTTADITADRLDVQVLGVPWRVL